MIISDTICLQALAHTCSKRIGSHIGGGVIASVHGGIICINLKTWLRPSHFVRSDLMEEESLFACIRVRYP